MINLVELKPILTPLPATYSGPRPGDFPVGSLKSRAAARFILKNHDDDQLEDEEVLFGELSPFVRATIEDLYGELSPSVPASDEDLVNRESRRWCISILQHGEEKAKAFGMPLPTPEEIRHKSRIRKLCNEMTEGQYDEICSSDPSEAKRLQELAEERLKAEARAIKKQESL